MAKGHENLIPFAERTEDEQRKIRSKGGKKSGEVRSFKAAIREQFESDPDAMSEIIQAMIAQCKKGNVQAANWLRDTVGEKPTEKTSTAITGELSIVWGDDGET